MLVENGQVKKVICAFTASTRPTDVIPFAKYYEAGEVDAELVPQGTLAERMRAAGAGIPAFYTPTAGGTELAVGRETRVINGREYLLEYALPLDYAFVRATRADTFGNLLFHRSQRNFCPVMAMAARIAIAEWTRTSCRRARSIRTRCTHRAYSCIAWSRCRRRPRALANAHGRSAR